MARSYRNKKVIFKVKDFEIVRFDREPDDSYGYYSQYLDGIQVGFIGVDSYLTTRLTTNGWGKHPTYLLLKYSIEIKEAIEKNGR